ncbi:hypothetical protein HLRTI_003071 [Halorhabdus tiamatea SARL4B]|uniref:DUF4367 domain-containing protein n=1 Tax=Halorhabdus tiamatea SARL4B TaxID=1033806 RepID=F7PGE3_9EURY|nr:hypothetical protein [Halorhabdus tiamatea]ERJ04953.1 hypothetical protein HLRTI_003071 [Halorhabdus tiamatea SARL4B]CCQ33832.1 hypothetical protein HTIA_1706 [Halorhabdus tiamatea SARL4B]
MESPQRGAIRLAGLAALVLGVVGIAAAAGFVVADDDPTGEAVLADVEEQYRTADSTVVDATVTVEGDDATRTFSVDSVATADGRMRVNVSDGDGFVLAGYDGTTSWLSSSELASPLVVSDSSALGNGSFVSSNGTVSMAGLEALASEMDANLTWDEGLDNASVEQFREAINESGLPTKWNESTFQDAWSDTELLAEWNESKFSEAWNDSDLFEDWNGNHSFEDWNGSEFQTHNWSYPPGDGDWTVENVSFDPAEWSVSTLFAETNLTAERVETTTLDGQEVHVVTVSAPERDGELRLWVTTDDAAVRKQQLSTSHATVTVEMETRFDVSPADSTFEPPMASSALGSESTADSLADLRASVDGPLAVPGDDWTFQRGSSLDSPVSVTVGEYAADGTTITVLQSESAILSTFRSDGQTADVGERTVAIAELDTGQVDVPGLAAGGSVATWTENGQTVAVAGDLPDSELREIVETIEFEPSD